MSISNTTVYFTYNKNSILSGRHASTFIRSSSGPLGKQIRALSIVQCIEIYIDIDSVVLLTGVSYSYVITLRDGKR